MNTSTSSTVTQPNRRPPTPGTPQFFGHDLLGFDFQFTRALGAQTFGGSELGECWVTARRIVNHDIESWYREWFATAERVHALAEAADKAGHPVSAREAFLRALTYYRTAQFYVRPEDPRKQDAYLRSRASFQSAARLMNPPLEVLSIAFDDGVLPAYFIPGGAPGERRPTVLILGGFDSTCEEMYLFGGGASGARRGYNVVLWEGPGQAGAHQLNQGKRVATFRPDYEAPAGEVIDHVLRRPDVDPERLALFGYSMGGYFAPRIAASDKRIKACVANSVIADLREIMMASFGIEPSSEPVANADELVDKSVRLIDWWLAEGGARLRATSVADLIEKVRPYTLRGLADQISCPILCIFEGSSEANHAHKLGWEFYEQLTCPKAHHAFTSEEGADTHCEVNNASYMNAVQFDWLDDVFGLSANRRSQRQS